MTPELKDDGSLDAPFLEKSYDEAMDLVHRTAAYLERDGAAVREVLPAEVRATFTGESLRLTTQLMQVVAWLMAQRAVTAGEIAAADALAPSRRLSGQEICLAEPLPGGENLPEPLQEVLVRSRGLYERILRVEERLLTPDSGANPVHELLGRLDRQR